jgi:hypothetical protein
MVDQLKNMDYIITGFDAASHVYRFVDGEFTRGADASALDFADLRLLDFFTFGDLNEDGAQDAAVVIAENYGGTGVFVSVAAVLNENGQPRHAASSMIDDRPQVNAIEIRDGKIILDAVVHSANDPACCPTFAVTRTFQLIGASLALVQATSQIPGGQARLITIETPSEGAEVSGALTISGRVTIAPFENNLRYRVYNEQGSELASGPVMVDAPDFGAPGTFTDTLELASLPPGRLYIEISDLSAADGSVLALASVMVVVR